MRDLDIIRVSNIQRLCVNDGPGVRTTVFLKGCYLNCPWCCNPEAINYDSDFYYKRGDCREYISGRLCGECEVLNRTRSKEDCPYHVFEKTFVDYNQIELFNMILRDKYYYDNGGGVTFSGGDPLFQSYSIKPLLQRLQDSKINIALETSLFAPNPDFCNIFSYIGFWLVDLKFQFGFFPNQNVAFETDFEQNLEHLQNNISIDKVKYRMVVMKAVLNNIDSIIDKLNSHRIDSIELLPYHNLGSTKYSQLGKLNYVFEPIDKCDMESLCAKLHNNNISANYLSQ